MAAETEALREPVTPLDHLAALTTDPEREKEWIETFLSVPSEDEGIVPWEVTVQQDKIITVSQRIRRLAIVKGRQTRCSTILEARGIHKFLTSYGQNFVIITQTDQMTQNFRTFIIDRLRELAEMGFECDPDNAKLWDLNNAAKLRLKSRKSTFHFYSAESKGGIRGINTAHWVHASEVAHWPDQIARDFLGGLLPACPPNGNFFAESTPNGAAGWFYDTVKDSMPLVPQSTWTTAFFPWWLEKKYTLSNKYMEEFLVDIGVSPDQMRMEFMPTPEEERLMSREGLDVNQMLWRRLKTKELLATGKYFAQEYPEDLLSCWLASGVGFFHDDQFDHIGYYRDGVKDPMRRYDTLTYKDPVTGVSSEAGFYGPNLSIWQPPVPGQQYVAFLDVSAGVSVEGDYSAMLVCKAESLEHVATLRMRTLPTRVGAAAAAVCAWYNWAFLGVERNTYGISALEELNKLHYPNLYYDVINQPNKPELGWFTSTQSRELMLNRFRPKVFDHTFKTQDMMMVLEMGGFTWRQVQGRTGNVLFRAEADKGNDDMVISAAGCCAIAPYAPTRIKSGGKSISNGSQYNENVYTGPKSMPWLGV